MIPKAKELRLIAIYFYVCERYENELKYMVQRYSNNSTPEFTDPEIMTIYLYVMQQEQRFRLSQIHAFAQDYLRSWFPMLPSYQAFVYRINKLSEAFSALITTLLLQLQPSDCLTECSVLDSMPVITCFGKRKAKVARDITDKGFCSTKALYYYGLKLHTLAFVRPKQLPFPEQFVITPASENDLNVFKQDWSHIEQRTFYGDKIYNDAPLLKELKAQKNSVILTPVKGVKNHSEQVKQWNKAAADLFSTAVSTIRQPIESLFNWLIEKTDIQRASKVRSTKGLLIHIFGRIATAFLYLIFKP